MNLKQIINGFRKEFYFNKLEKKFQKAIEQYFSTSITKLLEELRNRVDENPYVLPDEILGYYKGYNQRNQDLNNDINKILNNK
jgi:hypothetical protein